MANWEVIRRPYVDQALDKLLNQHLIALGKLPVELEEQGGRAGVILPRIAR